MDLDEQNACISLKLDLGGLTSSGICAFYFRSAQSLRNRARVATR